MSFRQGAKEFLKSMEKRKIPSIKERIATRSNVIVMGDGVSDLDVVTKEKRDKALKIGFLEENVNENIKVFKQNFDVVCTNNTSFKRLLEKVSILK